MKRILKAMLLFLFYFLATLYLICLNINILIYIKPRNTYNAIHYESIC